MPRQSPSDASVIVDARGLRCPLPVLRLARAMRRSPDARRFVLIADDAATPGELAAWCAATGHSFADAGDGAATILRR